MRDTFVELVQISDRIVVMGARDDTLSEFARNLSANITIGLLRSSRTAKHT